MSQDIRPHRIRHSTVLVFLLGGCLGSGLNILISLLLHRALGWTAAAVFCGTLANQLFHHVYYHVVYVNGEVRMRTPLPIQLTLYVLIAGLGAGLAAFFHAAIGWPFWISVVAVVMILSAANILLNRVSTFSSSTLADIEYRAMNESFYDDQTDPAKVGTLRARYHLSRHHRLTRFVGEYAKPGMKIADLGCGNCWWNTDGLDVTGVDVNERMLGWAKRAGRLRDFRCSDDLSRTGLPDRAFDLVVMSETLEHLLNVPEVLGEVNRILKDDGTFLITVPWDFFLGPFFVLFNLNCLYQGYVRGSRYHQLRCGHVNHFTRPRLRRVLAAGGFELGRAMIVNRLLIYAAARRAAGAPTGGSPAGQAFRR